jgi:hypothetical protein
MKKATICLLAILFAIVFCLVCRWFTASDSQSIKLAKNIAEPKIVFDQEAFDFGKVLEDVEIKHVFKISNEGKGILDVTGTYTSCGAIGPALVGPYKNPGYAAHMRQVIAQGSKTRPTMPGFSSTVGGPFNDKQIDSIVGYLKTLK